MSADCAQWSPGSESAGCAAAGAQFSPLIGPHVANSLRKVFEVYQQVETLLKLRISFEMHNAGIPYLCYYLLRCL